MTTLNWRTVDELSLNDKLIQNPSSISNLLAYLSNVRVAIEGAFLHIDARPINEPQIPGRTEYTVQVVPASAVEVIRYREPVEKKAPGVYTSSS